MNITSQIKVIGFLCFILLCRKTIWSQANIDMLLDQSEVILDSAKVKILLLGVFHFDYPGLDGHKSKDEYKMDVLTSQRQIEVGEIVRLLSEFSPTKIAVESKSQARIDSLYAHYLNGLGTDSRNEIVQLGFRLAKRMSHETVYAVDAPITTSTVSDEQFNVFEADFTKQQER